MEHISNFWNFVKFPARSTRLSPLSGRLEAVDKTDYRVIAT